MKTRRSPGPGYRPYVRTTMLELVYLLAREGRSESEIVTEVLELVNSGQVILLGTFRGTTLQLPSQEPIDVHHPAEVVQSKAVGQREMRQGTLRAPSRTEAHREGRDRTGG